MEIVLVFFSDLHHFRDTDIVPFFNFSCFFLDSGALLFFKKKNPVIERFCHIRATQVVFFNINILPFFNGQA